MLCIMKPNAATPTQEARFAVLVWQQPPQYLSCRARQVFVADAMLCFAVEGCLTAIYAFVILVRRALATVHACVCCKPARRLSLIPVPNMTM